MKIILNNGAELSPINVIGGKKTVQGANRDTLTFIFPGDTNIAKLDSIFAAANCESITIEDEAGTYIHKGYTVRVELSKASVCVSVETNEAAAVYEDRINVVMGQRTYTETKMAEMEAALNKILSAE